MKKKIKQIAVTGGKGGVGKSTIAVLLANKFLKQGKKVILCDLDVECPNNYLLLGQKLNKPKSFVFAQFPKLDNTKCQKCGRCVKVCRSNAVFLPLNKYPIFLPELCSGCGACWLICPEKAIKPKKVKTGKIFINQVNPVRKLALQTEKNGFGYDKQHIKLSNGVKKNFWLVTGEAKPGLEETGPVVAEVKKFVLNFAQKKKADLVLFDTAPGTHCPVIQALLNVDLAYIITEPTPMGGHDLKLILDLCQKLKVPVKIILNQADLGDKKIIEKVVKKCKIKTYKEIPYSKKLAEAYSKGELLSFKL